MTTATNSPERFSNKRLGNKLQQLERWLADRAPVAVGFSGGVDSTFLAAVCLRAIPHQTLLIRADNPLATTPERAEVPIDSPLRSLPLVTVPFDPLSAPHIAQNGPQRCYHCKRLMFESICSRAQAHGCSTVIDGSNASDNLGDRPGIRALQELGVRSPLLELGWTKQEERELLRAWGFALWDRPDQACLATRITTGHLSTAALHKVRIAEDILHEAGFASVRARLREGRMQVEIGANEVAGLQCNARGTCALPATVREAFAAAGIDNADPIVTIRR